MKTYRTDLYFQKITIGVLCALTLIVLTAGIELMNIPLIAIGVLIQGSFFARKGCQVDFKNKKIHEYTSVLFIKFGTWYDAEDYKNFQIGSQSSSERMMPNMAMSTTYATSNYAIFLRNKKDKTVVTLAKGDKKKMEDIAQSLESNLQILRKR